LLSGVAVGDGMSCCSLVRTTFIASSMVTPAEIIGAGSATQSEV
jgi:hypothetical protein